MHAHRTENELVIQETPGCLWFVGGFFALVGALFVYGALGGFSNWSSVPLWQLALCVVIGSSGVGIGFWSIHKAPISKLIIDRIDDRIILMRRGLFSRSKTVFSFVEVEYFCLVEDVDDEGNTIWDFGMQLLDGEIIKITSLATHSEQYHRNFVFAANEFARKHLPSATALHELENEYEN